MFKLTKRAVEALDIRDKDYLVWDTEMAGFGLRVFASGRKSYLVQYRAGGRTRRRSIGRHGILTAEEARSEARKLLGEVAKGGNPSEGRQRQWRAPSMASLCDRFLGEYAQARRRCPWRRADGQSQIQSSLLRPPLPSPNPERVEQVVPGPPHRGAAPVRATCQRMSARRPRSPLLMTIKRGTGGGGVEHVGQPDIRIDELLPWNFQPSS